MSNYIDNVGIDDRYKGNWRVIIYQLVSSNALMVTSTIGKEIKDPWELLEKNGDAPLKEFRGVNYDFCMKVLKLIDKIDDSSKIESIATSDILLS